MTNLLRPDGKISRAAVMRDAHKRYQQGKRLRMGWTFGHCLSTSWQAAKMQIEQVTYRKAA
jgi:hypothetical protein